MCAKPVKPIEQIRKEMEARSTGELRRIWETEYRHEWTDTEFEIVAEVLKKRGELVSTPTPQKLIEMLITTTPIIQGQAISQYLGVVSSVVVMGTGLLSEFGAGIADFLGTRAGGFQDKLARAREIALQEMKEQAVQRGGDAIVGVDFDYMSLTANMLMVSASGTVVKLSAEGTQKESVQNAT